MTQGPLTRVERRENRRRRAVARRRAAALAAVAVAALGGALVWWATSGDADSASKSGARSGTLASHHSMGAMAMPAKRNRATPIRLVERAAGRLAAPEQDAAAATDGARMILLGGLTGADTSRSDIRTVVNGRDTLVGRLPTALHDAAAVRIGTAIYLFGGGTGSAQLDGILRVDPLSGASRAVGRLPAPSSDQAAAELGGTAYVVGGYTGARWLGTIVAWRPGHGARVVARLPSAVRYAAVTAAAGRIVIAGGSLPSGSASRAVYAFDPRTRRVARIGDLPAPTTHAAAAALGGLALVIGGRGAATGTPTARIVFVDPIARRVRSAGALATPTSDLSAAAVAGRVLVAGGRSGSTSSHIGEIVRGKPRAAQLASVPAAPVRRAGRTLNVYAADGPNMLSRVVRGMPARVYVPNSQSNTVDVIDQRTFKVIRHFAVGALPQHVTPSWDLKTLYVDNDQGNSLTPISPWTGRPKAAPIPVDDPYNLYFTPNGRYAIVVAERNHRLDFRFAHSMKLFHSLHVPCSGVDHMDFSADGRYLIASCEFSGEMIKVDVRRQKLVGTLPLRSGAMPQDVKLSPDGRVFYVADMASNGVWEIDGNRFRVLKFMYTGRGAHGLYPRRDAKILYVTNRGEGSITLIDFATRRIVTKWWTGGSPDMGGLSADGKVLWLSGRYNANVMAISTKTGRVLARIPVGNEPHGLAVWPQPGRYSLGHTGILR